IRSLARFDGAPLPRRGLGRLEQREKARAVADRVMGALERRKPPLRTPCSAPAAPRTRDRRAAPETDWARAPYAVRLGGGGARYRQNVFGRFRGEPARITSLEKRNP